MTRPAWVSLHVDHFAVWRFLADDVIAWRIVSTDLESKPRRYKVEIRFRSDPSWVLEAAVRDFELDEFTKSIGDSSFKYFGEKAHR